MTCQVPAPVTPEPIHNRPALDSLRYRVGTFATFRRAMLEAIGRATRTGPAGEEDSRPLLDWTSRASDDYGIAFIEMWAYLGDVLSFYQERIANEAYLRTGTRESSTAHLVSLIGYRPAPGRAAVTWLAFRTEDDATVRIPRGLLVQSVPGQDEKPQKFQTVQEVEARASLNVLRPVTTKPQTLPRGATRAVLAGRGHDLHEGDWFAIVGEERRQDPGSERWDLRRMETVEENEEDDTTTVTWAQGLGSGARRWRGVILPASDPEFWVFRRQAWPFGYNAPDWNLFKATMSTEQGDIFKAAFPDWNRKHLPEDDENPAHIYLDTVYPGLVPGSWVALVTSRIGRRHKNRLSGYERYVELYPVLDVTDTTRLGYTLAARVTRLTVDVKEDGRPEHIEFFPIRGTVAMVDSQRLPLARVPLGHSAMGAGKDTATPVEGVAIELEGDHPDLHRGRSLLVSGTRLYGGPVGPGSEVVQVSSVSHEDEGRTRVTLTSPLEGAYERSSVVIYGNVAAATHGESVVEVLGDGDASRPYQSFSLTDGPVTHVPSPGAPGGAASTLEIRVDGVRWEERPELHGVPGETRAYITRRHPGETMAVLFGDGETGARVPSGRGNVEAAYRVGLGPEGNVGAGSLRTLLEKPLGLKSATNPGAAAGGAAPEQAGAVKRTAPGTVRTFGRIVSLRDFEDAALEYIGIAKAKASWRWDGEGRVVDLVVAGDDGQPVGAVMGDLQADLDARRDPHRPLRIREFTPLPISVAIDLVVDDDHRMDDVREAADAALRAMFEFDALGLGETVHLSDVHEAVMRTAGVVAVNVPEFRFKSDKDGAPQPRLLVGPGELAWVEERDDLRVAGARFTGRGAS
jgi:hypothetical protein